MDLVTECSPPLESPQDDQTASPTPDDHNENEIRNNGSCSNQSDKLAASPENLADSWPNHVQTAQPPEFQSKSPGGISSPTTKGFGLKKWRRIKRDVVKDTPATAVDASKILKRLLPGNANSSKPHHSSSAIEIKLSSEGSLGSANVFKNVVAVDSDSRIAVGSVFAAGTDSENSEDRSSKSSTAASAPKARNDLSAVLGHGWEKNKVKGMAAKNLGNSSQKFSQGKGKMETTKKARGERVRIEKENSHSSIESDSRSSNFFFTQGTNVTSNGKQIGRSMSYDGENSEEAHASEQQFSEEVQTGYGKENAGEVEDSQDDSAADASWGVKEEKSENNRFSADRDPLVESILSLQSVQEALEKEVQKLAEIGKEPILPDNLMEGSSAPSDFASPGIQEPYQSNQLGSETSTEKDVGSLEVKLLSLERCVKILESELDEAKTLLQVKDSKLAELEATINSTKFLKEESGSTIELQEKKYTEIDEEIEGLFKQRIEAEIEFLAITRATKSLKVVAEKQITVLEEQETVAEEQAQMLNKLGDAETKAAQLKKQAQELENHCGDILGTEEVLVTQSGVYKVTWCFCTQLILFILVVWLFVLQLSPHPGAVVPT
ncbi:WPP domain-interacting protein [Trema orientale]|uniref:WPP domain-interacting protein n=1 Tax=Trema orientale TaxID=63057 RepID=A0A2P5ETK0_TREOI|nr:WPP domain-interacting protein [Trema orientale]